MRLTLAELENDLSVSLPPDLVRKLLAAYQEIKENFYLGKHEPAELNAGKFVEVILRVLEHESKMPLTPFGTSIKNMGDRLRNFENATAANDSVRFHIPRVANAIYNIRNKRGVGHVGADVNPNLADSTIVASGSDWIVAELVRVHYKCSLEEAQAVVDGLVQRKIPLVHDIGGVKRVLNPRLTYGEKTLLLLAPHPMGVPEKTLLEWVEHSHATTYRRDVLRALHKQKLIEHAKGHCTILPPGLRLVEAKYESWASFEPSLGRPAKRK